MSDTLLVLAGLGFVAVTVCGHLLFRAYLASIDRMENHILNAISLLGSQHRGRAS